MGRLEEELVVRRKAALGTERQTDRHTHTQPGKGRARNGCAQGPTELQAAALGARPEVAIQVQAGVVGGPYVREDCQWSVCPRGWGGNERVSFEPCYCRL